MGKVPMPKETYSDNWEAWQTFCRYRGSLRFFTPQEEKGIPVPGTGNYRFRRAYYKNGHGVISGSHVVSHRYKSEGDKGKGLRREIKRKERVMVSEEITEGFSDWQGGPDDSMS